MVLNVTLLASDDKIEEYIRPDSTYIHSYYPYLVAWKTHDPIVKATTSAHSNTKCQSYEAYGDQGTYIY